MRSSTTAGQVRNWTRCLPASAILWRVGSASTCSTAAFSAPGCVWSNRAPVWPGLIRSIGPPAAGATGTTPEAWASWMVWQNVSCSPVCTNRSRLAKIRARSSPRRMPRKVAFGKDCSRAARSGPSPTMTRRHGVAASSARRLTFFSAARRPTYPTIGWPSGEMLLRNASSRCAGSNRSRLTPRPQWCTRGTPFWTSCATVADEGARVRTWSARGGSTPRHRGRPGRPRGTAARSRRYRSGRSRPLGDRACGWSAVRTPRGPRGRPGGPGRP